MGYLGGDRRTARSSNYTVTAVTAVTVVGYRGGDGRTTRSGYYTVTAVTAVTVVWDIGVATAVQKGAVSTQKQQ